MKAGNSALQSQIECLVETNYMFVPNIMEGIVHTD